MSTKLSRPDRKLLVSSAVLLVLVLLYLLGFLVGRPSAPARLFPHFTPEGVASISLTKGSAKLELRKGGEGWEVIIDGTPYPANQARAQGILGALRELSVVRLASRSEADWTSFGLDRSSAMRVVARGSHESLADVLTGITDASGGGLYVRLPGSANVEEVTPQLASYLVLDTSFWSDLKILPASFTVESLQSISVTAHGFSVGGTIVNDRYLLEAGVAGGASRWKLHGELQVNLDQQKVLDMEAELLTMVGEQFAPSVSDSAAGFAAPVARIVLSNQQGDSVTLLVGKRDGSRFYVKRSGSPYVYLVNQYSLQRALPSRSSLEAR